MDVKANLFAILLPEKNLIILILFEFSEESPVERVVVLGPWDVWDLLLGSFGHSKKTLISKKGSVRERNALEYIYLLGLNVPRIKQEK